ncbi:MAG: aminotransferase class I/II-fold pyridoxal phosphate-dependent enzyme [Peptostreptococcaceae bacterium]|jgi:threonine aldolase|nr:aminotransferase class I/II-fold pyridoxal phosphate-dependent enzyme [Peptostreptococcaceae bacterium]
MYNLKDDYSEGAHPKIIESLVKSNLVQEDGYSMDSFSKEAIRLLKQELNNDDVDIHFISGGTQTNLLAISSVLRPHEACISATTGHIATHEAGAIEATGHKVIMVDTEDGKLNKKLLKPVLQKYNFEYAVKPKVVYISNPTELGTVYSKEELKSLYDYCLGNNLLLYLDGARLASAIALEEMELSLENINKYSDAFFLGGTKNGALLGEALILSNDEFKKDFRYILKQKGAMLAKGRIMGIQFKTLLEDQLYLKLGAYANGLAKYTNNELRNLGIEFLVDSPSNQIFPILENNLIKELRNSFNFYDWEKISEDKTCIRLVFSWATKEEKVKEFVNIIKNFKGIN